MNNNKLREIDNALTEIEQLLLNDLNEDDKGNESLNYTTYIQKLKKMKNEKLEKNQMMKQYFDKLKENIFLHENFSNFNNSFLNYKDKSLFILENKYNIIRIIQKYKSSNQIYDKINKIIKNRNDSAKNDNNYNRLFKLKQKIEVQNSKLKQLLLSYYQHINN